MLNAKELKEFLEELEEKKNIDLKNVGVYVCGSEGQILERASEMDYDGDSVNIWS